MSEFLACAPNPSLGSFSEAKDSENLFVIPLDPKSGLPDAAVAGNTGTYDVWQGAGAFVQFEVNPPAVKTASGLIEVDASNEYPGTQGNQKEPSPIIGDHELLAVSGPAYQRGLINSQIVHGKLVLFQLKDTIQPKLRKTFAAEETCTSERSPQDTETEGVESTQTNSDPITPGAGRKWIRQYR